MGVLFVNAGPSVDPTGVVADVDESQESFRDDDRVGTARVLVSCKVAGDTGVMGEAIAKTVS
jgi:hypothetical protein